MTGKYINRMYSWRNLSLKVVVCLMVFIFSGCTLTKESTKVNSAVVSKKDSFKLDADTPWSIRMGESIMNRNPESWMTDFRETPRWSYTHGLVLQGIQKLYIKTGDKRYFDYVQSYYDTMITEDGIIKNYNITDYNIDHINPGKNLFLLFDETNDPRYEKVIKTLKKQLDFQPRTKEGGYWHKLRYTYQMWLDGLFMGEPFYAQYAQNYNQEEAFDDIVDQFVLMEKHARDDKTGLLHHGWDESKNQRWSDPQTGKSQEIWGRAVGWYAMGLVDALDFFPEDHPRRGELIEILNRLSVAVANVQDEKTGTGWQVMDKPNAEGNYLEATVSIMLTYALIKGIRKGYLDETYLSVAQKSYDGILETFVDIDPNGAMHINKCCAVAGLGGDPYRDGTFDYYINERVVSNDTKATGPFIFMALEFEALNSKSSN